MSASQVYPEISGQTSSNGTKKQRGESVTDNVPEDPLFVGLYAGRRVSYLPQIAEALRRSEAPKRLLDRHTEAATLLASDLIYWTPKSWADGWIYKSREEFWEETGLPERRQRRARELLREAGVLEEKTQGFRLYYRIRWYGLKPLLRLAAEGLEDSRGSRGDTNLPGNSASHGDANYSGSHGDAGSSGRMVTQRSGSHGDPTSVMYSDCDIQTGQDQSIDAREYVEDVDSESPSSGAGVESDGSIDSLEREDIPVRENAGRNLSEGTLARKGHALGEIGNEGRSSERSSATVGPFLQPAPRSLRDQIRREMEGLSASEISEDVRLLAEALAKVLGHEQADTGMVRVAGYVARHNIPELLGEVAARSGAVRHPLPFFSKSLAQAIKDDEAVPSEPRRGSIIERFETAYMALRPDNNQRSEDDRASSDTEGRRSLTGRNMTPIYGVAEPDSQQESAPAFRMRKPRRSDPESEEESP